MENRIKELRISKGLSQDQLAQLAETTNQQIGMLERGDRRLSDVWIERIAKALDVSPAELFEERPEVRLVAVRGAVQAGAWAENPMWDPDEWYNVPIPDDPKFKKFRLHGAETRGPSMDKVYPEHTILIFTDAIETEEDVILGKRYVVERERADGLREATVKTLWQDENRRLWLVPESSDPRFQEPIAIDGEDGDTIRIVGRVVYSVRQE